MTPNPSTERAEAGGSWPLQGWPVCSEFQASLKLRETLAQNKTKQKPYNQFFIFLKKKQKTKQTNKKPKLCKAENRKITYLFKMWKEIKMKSADVSSITSH